MGGVRDVEIVCMSALKDMCPFGKLDFPLNIFHNTSYIQYMTECIQE